MYWNMDHIKILVRKHHYKNIFWNFATKIVNKNKQEVEKVNNRLPKEIRILIYGKWKN